MSDPFQTRVDLLWGKHEQPRQGRRRSLDLDEIVATAVRLADTEGIDALSMRQVAGELGVGTMSLYRYIPSKDDLLDLMVDRVSAPSEEFVAATALPWREALTTIAGSIRAGYLAHPWLLQINLSRVYGPNVLAGVEHLLAALGGIGLTDRERVTAMTNIDAYVVGATRQEVLYQSASAETGMTDEEFWARQGPVLGEAMATGNYPTLANLSEDSFTGGWDESFTFGLNLILDGIAALVAARSVTNHG